MKLATPGEHVDTDADPDQRDDAGTGNDDRSVRRAEPVVNGAEPVGESSMWAL